MSRTRRDTAVLVATSALGAAALGVLGGLLWPTAPGVVLDSGERGQVGLILGVICGLSGLGLGLGSFLGERAPRRRQVRWAGALGAALWAAMVPAGLSILGPGGEEAVGTGGVVVVLVALLAMVPLLRSRFAVGGLLLASGAVLVLLDATPEQSSGAAEVVGPAVWILTLDTVRADHLDFSGSSGPHAHTPNLSALAAESRVYTQAFAPAALTGPSHASLWTGQSPEEHGVLSNGQEAPTGGPWLPEILREAGWVTRGLVSAAVLDVNLGFGRGFDAFDSTFQDRTRRGHPGLRFLGHDARVGTAHDRPGGGTVGLMDDLPAGWPAMTWVHLYDAHWPYSPSAEAAARQGLDDPTPIPDDPDEGGIERLASPEARDLDPALVERGKRLYRAGLEDLDALVGQVLEQVPEDAVLIVVGDHGESLDEHDYHFSHGRLPYAPDTQVPLLVRLPGQAAARVDTPVSLVDLAPTVLTAVGQTVPGEMSGTPLQSLPQERVVRTLTPIPLLGILGRGEDGPGRVAGVALRDGRQTWTWTRFDGHQLFDRSSDPLELQGLPLAADDPVATELDALVEAAGGGRLAAVPEEVLPALEALGYIEASPASTSGAAP